MSTVVPIARGEQRLEAASRWILALDDGASAEQQDALKAWLAEDPENVSTFLEVARVWDKTEDLKRLAELFPADLFSREAGGKSVRGQAPRSWRRRAANGMALTAMVIAAVGAGYLLQIDALSERPRSGGAPLKTTQAGSRVLDYETAIGEQSSILLPDGSVAVLNTNSHLQVEYSGTARVLLLNRGEVHVEVAVDRSRPLSVVAGDRVVQAVGTAFSVELTDRRHVEVVVTDGRVVVGVSPKATHPGGSTADGESLRLLIPAELASSDAHTVNAGEELVLGAINVPSVPVPISADDIEVRLSWREGRLVFRSEPLEDALREVERYTTVQFVFLDEELKSRTMTGRYRAGDVESLLLALRANFNITHEYASENRVLLSSI